MRYHVIGPAGATTHLRIVLPDGGGAVAGRVLDPDGHPLAHARVRAGPWDNARCIHLDDGSAYPVQREFETRTDAAGRFRIEGLECVKSVVHAWVPHFAPRGAEIDVKPGATAQVDIALRPGGSVAGTVKDGAGVPIRDALVLAGRYGDFLSAQCHTDAQGRYRLVGLTPTDTYPLTARAEGKGEVEATLAVKGGAVTAWDPVITEGTVTSGRVLDEAGRPRAKWLVHMGCMQLGLGWQDSAITDADGRFAVRGCPNDFLRIEVTAPAIDGEWTKYPSAVRTDVRPGSALDVVVKDRDLPTAFLVGTVLDADGRPKEGAQLRVQHPDQPLTPYQFVDAGTGKFRVGPLPPAAYDVTVIAKGCPEVRMGTKEVRPEEELDLGTIRVVAGGVLAVKAKRENGAAVTRVWGEVLTWEGAFAGPLTGEGDVASCPELPPGRYAVRVNENVSAKESWIALAPVEVRAGEKTTVDVVLARAGRKTFRGSLAKGGAFDATIRLVIRTVAGTPFADTTIPLSERRLVGMAFPLGSYVAQASTKDGLRADVRFDVTSVDEDKDMVQLEFR